MFGLYVNACTAYLTTDITSNIYQHCVHVKCSTYCVFSSSFIQSGTVECITLRTISSQTDSQSDRYTSQQNLPTNVSEEDEEDVADDIAETEYRDVLIHRIQLKNEMTSPVKALEPLDLSVSNTADADGTGTVADDNIVSSSSDESQSEQEIGTLFDDLNVINDNEQNERMVSRFRFRRAQFLFHVFFTRCLLTLRAIRYSRSRMILTIFWFLYGAIIVCISRAFLPWMSFYTIIYFIIIYAELQPPE